MDLSKLTVEELQALLAKVQEEGKGAKQKAAYDRALGEERQKMMDERGTLDNIRAGIGKSIYDTGRGLSQLFGGMSREEVDQTKALDAPLMKSGGGITGNVLGQIGQSMLPLGAARLAAAVPGRVGAAVNALPGANTVLGGAALGGGQGFIQPVGTEDSRFVNTALGTFAGGAIPAGVAGYRATRAALDPMTAAGRDRVTGRMLNQFATNPEQALERMAAGKSNVPGVMPSVGEATLDPGLATLERSMLNFPGPMQGAMSERLAQNNAARQKFLEAIGGTADELSSAKAAASSAYERGIAQMGATAGDVNTPKTVQLIDRILASPKAESPTLKAELTAVRAQLFEPYPAAERLGDAAKAIRDAVERAHKRGINAADIKALEAARSEIIGKSRMAARMDPAQHKQLADAALERLYQLETKSKGAQEAVQSAVDLLGAQNVAFKRDPARLAEIYKTINTRIGALDSTSGKDVEAIKALTSVKRSLANWMDAATGYKGGYSKVNRDYSAAKKEINQMEVLQGIRARDSVSGAPRSGVDALGNASLGERELMLSGFLKATDPAKKVKAGGRDVKLEQLLNPQRADDLATLRADAARALEARNSGKAMGSPTAQFLYAQNLLGQTLGPLGLPTSLADRMVGAVTSAPFIGAPLAAANRYAGRGMAQHVSEAMMDPQRAASLMGAANQAQMRALNPGVSRLLPPTLAGLATGMFGSRQLPQEEPPYGARW